MSLVCMSIALWAYRLKMDIKEIYMVVAHADFDRKVFKFATAILLLSMIFRHAMFYLDFGRINTEMGFDQSLFGVFLIPVTASFGCIFFWERKVFFLW